MQIMPLNGIRGSKEEDLKMKEFKKIGYITVGMVITIIMSTITPVFAVTSKDVAKQLTANLTVDGNPISVYVNGTKITPKDSNGKEVPPFIVDGTTYLPVRAIAEALEQVVKWDEDTATVVIDSKISSNSNTIPTSDTKGTEKNTDVVKELTAYFTLNEKPITVFVSGKKIAPKDSNGNDVAPFCADGTTYLPVRAIAEALGKEIKWDGDTASVKIDGAKGLGVMDEVVTVASEIHVRKDDKNAKLITTKNAKGQFNDKLEYTFTLDKDTVGEWKGVGFYKHLREFNPEKPLNNPYFTGMSIYEDGTMARCLDKKNVSGFHWTEGYFVDLMADFKIDSVSAYALENIKGKTYMFVEWKSGDYVRRGDIGYYVFEKVSDTPAPVATK
jgi:hypothetical protein